MSRLLRLISAGGIALAFGIGGISVGHAWYDQNGGPVPTFVLPSDRAPGMNDPYSYRTDPTGEVTENQPTAAEANLPSNTTNDQFLTYLRGDGRRLDTTDSACSYYKVIGAVSGCGSDGRTLQDAITFDTWKQYVAIDEYSQPPGTPTDIGHFINQVDLNLTRDHHMISYGPNQLAGYVCNHSGSSPTKADPTGLFPSQHEIDALIKDINRKHPKNLIACVAMEYSVNVTYNPKNPDPVGTAFTKFWIFGAKGELLSTVDLDGRGPKGVPGVCTACHGGTFDSATLTSGPDGTMQFNSHSNGNLEAHFLPFDKDNFVFSSKLPTAEQEEAVFKLNLDVYTTEINRVKIVGGLIANGGLASASITDLIRNWYHDSLTRDNPSPGFDPSDTVPIQWDFLNFNTIYLNSYAHSCRTCHVAMERVPLEREPGLISSSVICNSHVMPNSKVTFDRFWLSDPNWTFPPIAVPGQPASAPNQPSLLNEITGCGSFNNP